MTRSSSRSSSSSSNKSSSSRGSASSAAPVSRNASTISHHAPPPSASRPSTPSVTKTQPPPPPANAKHDAVGMAAKGAAVGLAGGLLAAVILPKVFGTRTRPVETSDLVFGLAGASAGAGSYSAWRYFRKSPQMLFRTGVCGAIGAFAAIMYNGHQLEKSRNSWQEHIDESSGQKYYFHPTSGETTWDKPI